MIVGCFWSSLTFSVVAAVLPVCPLLCIQYFSLNNTDFEHYQETKTLNLTADCPVSHCVKTQGSVLLFEFRNMVISSMLEIMDRCSSPLPRDRSCV